MNGRDVKRIREEVVFLSQSKFSEIYGINLYTLRQWERKGTDLDKTVSTYIECIKKDHKVIEKIMGKEVVQKPSPKKQSVKKSK